MQPLVSVMMIAYNQENFIDEAIRGVILQEVPFGVELVIGDDCSTDSTAERCRRWQEKYPDVIRLLPRNENLGVQRNYIDVYSHCRGRYIAVCEGDDYWCDRTKLKRQVEYMEAHVGCTVCFHRVVNYYIDTRTMSLSNGGQREDTTVVDLARSNYITNLSVMYRRGVFGELPVWVEQVAAPDYVFHMLHASKGYIHYISRPMAVYRQSAKGVWSMVGEKRRLRMSMDVRERLMAYFAKEPDIVSGLNDAYTAIAISLILACESSGGEDDVPLVRGRIFRYRPGWDDDDLLHEIERVKMLKIHSRGMSVGKIMKKIRAMVSYFMPRPRI